MFGNQKLFISHTHEDNQLCQPLLAALDAWQLDYWFDTQELDAGQRFSDRIQQALDERNILLRICTTAAQHSFWMNRELRAVRGLRGEFPQHPRVIVHLVLTSDYVVDAGAHNEVVIDATKISRAAWLHDLHHSLGFDYVAPRVSRRAIIGTGVLSVAAMAATGTVVKLLLSPPATRAGFVPTTRPATATPQPGGSRLRWEFSLTFFVDATEYNMEMVADENGVYAIYEKTIAVFALKVSDGTRLWNYPKSSAQLSNGIVAQIVNNTLFLLALYGPPNNNNPFQLIAVDKTTGEEQWRNTVGADVGGTSQICFSDNTLFFQYGGKLWAYNQAGKVRWPAIALFSFDPVNSPPQQSFSTPAFYNGVVYIGTSNGNLLAIDATSGSIRWSVVVTPPSLGASAASRRVESGIAIANGLVFVSANDGYLRAFDARTGALRWNTALTTILPASQDDYATIGTPLVVNNVIYLSAGRLSSRTADNSTLYPQEGKLFALNAQSGKILWQVDPIKLLGLGAVASPNVNPPIVTGETVYFAVTIQKSNDTYFSMNTLFALNNADGTMQWHYDVTITDTPPSSGNGYYPATPALVPGGVVFASCDGKISVLNT